MDVYLVRHAIAHDRDPRLWPDDADRPLTEEGEDQFRRAARGLARIVPTVDAMLASPFARAWRTAELLSEEAGWPPPERCPALEADRPARDVLKVIVERGALRSLALVGHEPQLSELASRLLAGRDDAVGIEMKKGGVAGLLVEDGAENAWLRFVAPPKLLRGLARSKA